MNPLLFLLVLILEHFTYGYEKNRSTSRPIKGEVTIPTSYYFTVA